jgi:hypothetical protein
MQWENYVSASENLLSSSQIPSSLDIITLIKKVNPTKLTLSESDRERGYQLKTRLQSLLLQHYGDAFHLVPHPASPNIILIKHRVLLSIDACHAPRASLSSEAVESVEAAPPYPAKAELKRGREKGRAESGDGMSAGTLSPKKALKKAQFLLEKFDYTAAEEVLSGLRAGSGEDLPVLLRAASILLDEIGAYERCIDTLLSQPKNILKDRELRELLAVAYHRNGSLAEARAIFDELYPAELGLASLFAYADIAFKDGNLTAARELVGIARGREGYFTGLDSLEKEIEAAMSAQAEPVVQKAQAALQAVAFGEARQLAREALELYPNCQQARAIISAIEAGNAEAQRAELWARLANEQCGERRIPLLTALLEQDKEKMDTIRRLLAEEKERRRRRLFDERLEKLRSLVRQECWAECFDTLSFLMRQPEFQERTREVLSLCPHFTALHDNRQLQGATDRSARDLWLRYVKARTAFAAGNGTGSFEAYEELRPWFGSSPGFQDDYLTLLQREQGKARTEIAALLAQSAVPETPVGEVRRIFGALRKRMPVLPCEERRNLVRTMEERLAQLIPGHDPARLLEEYREALRIGHSEKAAYLRQEIIDTTAREAVDAEFSEAYRIAWEPLTLEVSDDLPIDLISPLPFTICIISGQRIFMKEGENAYVMLDFGAQTACRITSPVFAKAKFFDSTWENSYLLVEVNDKGGFGDQVWRVAISPEGAAFTASFNIRESFEIEEGYSPAGMMVSGERETDYYLKIKHDDGLCPAKLLRIRLASKATLESLQMGNRTDFEVLRTVCAQDSFLLSGEEETRMVNRNLSLKARLRGKLTVYKMDGKTGNIYSVEDSHMLTQRNRNLEPVKHYEKATCFGMYEPGRVHGISYPTDIALIVLGDGLQSFYNLRNNKFSNKIRVGRVIPLDDRWYCFDFNRKEGRVVVRDITKEIQTELEWREFFFPRVNRKKMEKLMLWFHDHDNFVYRPGEWGDCNPSTQHDSAGANNHSPSAAAGSTNPADIDPPAR